MAGGALLPVVRAAAGRCGGVDMNRFAKTLVLVVILLHVAAFVVEAFLWMRPGVHELMLNRLTGTVSVDLHDQALILKSLFVNQGFYNLFLATAGISGLSFVTRGNATIGYTLISYMCLSAIGAGVVLAVSTHAYFGALLQAVPAAVALAALYRAHSAARGE
jgi:putative membrane protein